MTVKLHRHVIFTTTYQLNYLTDVLLIYKIHSH